MDKKSISRFCSIIILVIIMSLMFNEALATDGTVNCSSLVLRKAASKDSKALQSLPRGTILTIKSTSGDWYKVSYGGITGYVMRKYVTKGKASSSTTSSSASNSSSSLRSIGKPKPCEPGDNGSNVKKLQKCLRALGYYSEAIDGDYGSATKKAVKKLQKAKGLKQTGIANQSTINAMFGTYSSSNDSNSKTETERLNWFRNGQDKIPKGATFTVKDCKTGKTFKCKRWSGSNHLDAEPLTSSDAKILKSLYGGHWSWKRRAILVKYNGHVYAASMNGMPHGTTTIKNNGFDGHFCIHFYGSKTHGTKHVDETHQNCVSTAMKYSW